MRIGDEVMVHGYVDEIRSDCIIIRNEGGYFGTAENEVYRVERTADTPQTESSAKVTEKFGKGSDTPQTDCYNCGFFWSCDGQCDEVPQTDCSWK